MTKKTRFTAEFKQEAASLVLDQNYTQREACDSTGVSESAMDRWVTQLRAKRSGITPQGKAISPDHQRIQELEKLCKRLEMERDILKKATALLMSDEFKSMR